ncbi:hypothetical protein Tsubulata_016014 [Turnera subulata]|uniref:GTD-binding domain-containing protein n=1 Tax=Turnera subulata TaxID=218843 RepID=A0A9Q0FL75_9ROSI|nr:hypothetical protein Tsubulata_016014 [Turnera subulata]
MQILVRFCLSTAFCSVLDLFKGFWRIFWGLLLMAFASFLKLLSQNAHLFKGGSFAFRYFAPSLYFFWLVLVFGVGLKFLGFTWHGKGLVQFLCAIRGKSDDPKNGFCSKKKSLVGSGPEVKFRVRGSSKSLEASRSRSKENPVVIKKLVNSVSGNDRETERCVEDEESDVMALRRLVKTERMRAKMASAELEKERLAAATAAKEAMAMILRLQSEKSAMEIEANQFRKLAEQKLEYYEQVIESLRWDAMEDESEKGELEENLMRFCAQKFSLCESGDEVTQDGGFEASSSFSHPTTEDGLQDLSGFTVDFHSSAL